MDFAKLKELALTVGGSTMLELIALVERQEAELAAARAPAAVEQVDALTDEQIATMAYEKFGIVADDSEVIAFARAILEAARPAASVQPDTPDVRLALAGLHKVCHLALQGKDGKQHAYFETRAGHFVDAVKVMEAAEVALAAPVQAAPEGWQLVPKIATEKMEVAMKVARKITPSHGYQWHCALAAAPAPREAM